MLSIRFKRIGKKNQPSYRVIVTPKKAGGPKGKPIEYLGWFNPFSKEFALKKERILYWLSQGAKTSDSLQNLLIRAGIIKSKKIAVHKKSKKKSEPSVQSGASQEQAPDSVQEPKPAEATGVEKSPEPETESLAESVQADKVGPGQPGKKEVSEPSAQTEKTEPELNPEQKNEPEASEPAPTELGE
ncbi:MAG: 30S ribosomal protein S16 [Patescibacteria group bacterium]